MEKEKIELENKILDKLSGKVFLLQDPEQKRHIVFKAIAEVCGAQGQEAEKILNEVLSYGIIEEYLSDPQVEDVIINSLLAIHIHKAKIGMMRTENKFGSVEELELFIRKLVIFSGRTTVEKINNVELSDLKGRANIVYSPFGPQVTITRAKEDPLSVIDLVKIGTLMPEIAAQFWLYVEGLGGIKPANIIIAGGPGSGKSSLLNALFSFVPAKERVVVIEDTLELNTNSMENYSRVVTDEEMSLADLVKNSLRMRPDRVMVGEVRGQDAQDLLTAMNIGKYCMCTLHASTAREAILRLQNEPMNVPEVLVNLIDVFVIMQQRKVGGEVKRVVGELVETAGMEQKKVLLSPLWSCNLSKHECERLSISSVYRDKLAHASGKDPKEIMDELKNRVRIINRLVEKNITDINTLTDFFSKYSENPKIEV